MSWKEVEIGNLVELRQGLCINKKSNHLVAETGLPLLRITDMINNKNSVFIKEEVPEKYIAKYEDIIYSRTGQVGLVFRHQFGVLFNNCFTVSPISDELSRDYLYWFLRCDDTKKMANDYASGAAQLDLSHSAFKCIKIKYPKELTTQRKIASILSAYDDLIENNLKRIKLLEEAINTNYKNLISTGDKNFANIKLNTFVDIISGFPFKSTYYNENGKHKIVTIKNVQDGFFVPLVSDRIEDIPDNMNKALFLSTGDVIMSLTGNVGRVCLVYGDDYVLNQRVVKLSAKELIDQSFIYALVRDKQMLTILENLSNGTAQQNLSPIKMGELPIKYPSSNLRKDFNRQVSPMIEMICKLNIQNTKLREARDILLPKLMNGQIEV